MPVHNGQISAMDPTAPRIISEIQQFIDSRYVGACEAAWRILQFEMSGRFPSVMRLQLHEENAHQVLYQEGEEMQATVRGHTARTTLTAYFECVKNERQNPLPLDKLGQDTHGLPYPRATELTYIDFPAFYSWQAAKHVWTRRRMPHKTDTIGRLYSAHPNSGERFYLRMLLCVVKGADSFKYLRTVNGEECDSYKNACLAFGILADDVEWSMCLKEASTVIAPKSLRDLFCAILHNNQPI